MTKKLIWRLGELPTPEEVIRLIESDIITKEEAKAMLFKEENEEERDKKSLQEEIKFLRELVQKLSNNNRIEIVKQIEYIEKPYRKWEWYEPYKFYCTTGSGSANAVSTLTVGGSTNTSNNAVYMATGSNTYAMNANSDFSSIKTF